MWGMRHPHTHPLATSLLSAVVEAAALTAAYRLPRSPHRGLETCHCTIWKKAEKVDNKFAITKYHATPRYSLDNHIKGLYLSWKSGKNVAEKRASLVHE